MVVPLLPAVASDFGTTVAAAGLLITSYAIPYGLFQLIYGPLADRFSRQRVMGVALSLFALGTFAGGWSPNFSTLNFLRLCTGAAAAGVIPVALAYVGDAFPYHERQAALGRVVSVAALGGVLSAALGGIVASLATWRVLFIGYGLLALVVGAVLLRLPVQRVVPHRERRGVLMPYRDVFRHAGRRAAVLYGLVFCEGMVATSTLGYLGGLLFERDHMSYATIGMLHALWCRQHAGSTDCWAAGGAVARARHAIPREYAARASLPADVVPAGAAVLPGRCAHRRRWLCDRSQHASNARDRACAVAARHGGSIVRVLSVLGRRYWNVHSRAGH